MKIKKLINLNNNKPYIKIKLEKLKIMIKCKQLIRGEQMLDKICDFLTSKIRKEIPEIDEERAEVINYGLQNIIGEIPKIILVMLIAYVLGIFKGALFTFLALFPYKGASGGVHLKTHLGCILMTTAFYCIIPFIAKMFIIPQTLKYFIVLGIWIFGMIMIKLYAPADTENVPILCNKDRKKKRIVSYITFSIGLFVALIINNEIASNILIAANLFQTITITRFMYKITNNKYGHEVYNNITSTELS